MLNRSESTPSVKEVYYARLAELDAAAHHALLHPAMTDPEWAIGRIEAMLDTITEQIDAQPSTCVDCDEPVASYRLRVWEHYGQPATLCRACYADREDFLASEPDCRYPFK